MPPCGPSCRHVTPLGPVRGEKVGPCRGDPQPSEPLGKVSASQRRDPRCPVVSFRGGECGAALLPDSGSCHGVMAVNLRIRSPDSSLTWSACPTLARLRRCLVAGLLANFRRSGHRPAAQKPSARRHSAWPLLGCRSWPNSTRSRVSGSLRWRTPVAWNTALAIAGAVPTSTGSATFLAP